MLVFASDLDNTLIYSHKRIQGDCICVETKEGRELSYMTVKSYEMLQKLEAQLCFVPITTRSLEQYERLRLLEKKQPPLALVSNGGILLVDGKVDKTWQNNTLEMARESRVEIEKAYKYLEKDENRNFDIRRIDDLFLFTKSNNPAYTIEALKKIVDGNQVSVIENYQKVYVVPKFLHKGLAMARLKKRLTDSYIISAGDSSFDIPMLMEADKSIALDQCLFRTSLKSKAGTYYYKGKQGTFSEFVLDVLELEYENWRSANG